MLRAALCQSSIGTPLHQILADSFSKPQEWDGMTLWDAKVVAKQASVASGYCTKSASFIILCPELKWNEMDISLTSHINPFGSDRDMLWWMKMYCFLKDFINFPFKWNPIKVAFIY